MKTEPNWLFKILYAEHIKNFQEKPVEDKSFILILSTKLSNEQFPKVSSMNDGLIQTYS